MTTYTTTVANNNITITAAPVSYALSLSRTGGQGSKGDSVTGVSIAANGDIIFTLEQASGGTTDVNVGSIYGDAGGFNIASLSDVDTTGVTDNDILAYDSSAAKFTTRNFTTDQLEDINNAGKAEGALLVYNATTSKYDATNSISNASTNIIGGSY
jgi:hypothetical protein